MFRKSVVRGFECCSVVAPFAAVFPGGICKLPMVLIGVAIDAMGELDLESSRVAGRCVARGALDSRVWKGEGEAGSGVISDRK